MTYLKCLNSQSNIYIIFNRKGQIFAESSKHKMANWNNQTIKICLIVTLSVMMRVMGQTCTEYDDQFLITFHPHLDAFWLNSYAQLKDIHFVPALQQYQLNQRNSKTILDSMLISLKGSPNRKYFVTEVLFFKDWYQYIDSYGKQQVKKLLKNGQLEIGNGGWVQNDEAVCYYDDILDQYTIGMNYLYQQFSYEVKIGWSTDSFGHSHSQAALQHILGIQFQGIERVDQRFVNLHNGGPMLEFYWQPVSDSNNRSYGGVFTHVRHFLHQISNLRYVELYSVQLDFTYVQQAMQSNYYKKNKLFRFLGNDFQEFTPEEFTTIEQVMDYMNKQTHSPNYSPTCPSYKYGNPSDYLKLVTKYYEKSTLPKRKYDLMPNWDTGKYWSGYYTTDPALKKLCKDYSRIVNFYRKSLLSLNLHKQNHMQYLKQFEELLAIIQHHDGITATSRAYIEDQLKDRMVLNSASIFQKLRQIHGGTNSINCRFDQNHNQCDISNQNLDGYSSKYLNILTHGASKKQKIQIILPNGIFYDIQEVQQDIFCQYYSSCVLVFQASLKAGVNAFTLIPKTKQQLFAQIFDVKTVQSKVYYGRDYTITANSQAGNNIRYEYGFGEYFDIGLFISNSGQTVRQTMKWDKYGNRSNYNQYFNAGLYIMANSGTIQPIQEPYTQLKFAQGTLYKRAILTSMVSKLRLTIKNDQPNIIDVANTFQPNSTEFIDYFMKVSSNVKSDTLYHDANGFLVAKRLYNQRPDYQFIPNQGDAINGNTYPVCSFAYLLQNNKKFLFFTDRAQGVSTYNNDLLINFDRLAGIDGKGVNQYYTKKINNTFRYKLALIPASDDLQRTWQREYDQALIGFISQQAHSIRYKQYNIYNTYDIPISPGYGPKTNLKYTIFYLNEQEYVIRLQNMGQFKDLTLDGYRIQGNGYRWVIAQIGFDTVFKDIKQSYANGIPKQAQSTKEKWRKFWGNNNKNIYINSHYQQDDTITILNQDKQDNGNGNRLRIRPLQIRSFRININNDIVSKVTIRPGVPYQDQYQVPYQAQVPYQGQTQNQVPYQAQVPYPYQNTYQVPYQNQYQGSYQGPYQGQSPYYGPYQVPIQIADPYQNYGNYLHMDGKHQNLRVFNEK